MYACMYVYIYIYIHTFTNFIDNNTLFFQQQVSDQRGFQLVIFRISNNIKHFVSIQLVKLYTDLHVNDIKQT